MGAPVKNKNAARAKEFRDALTYALQNYKGVKKGQALREIANALIAKAIEGDISAIREVGDRLDGKPMQGIVGEDGGALQVTISVKDAEVL